MLLSEKLKEETKNGYVVVNDVLIDEIIKLEQELNKLMVNEEGIIKDKE